MIQSRRQRLIVILTGFSLLAALLFPPWLYTFDQNGNQGGYGSRPAGYFPLFWAPAPRGNSFSGVRIDPTRLLLECACVGIVSAMAFLFATSKPPSPRSVERQDKPPSGKMENVTPPATLTGNPTENSAEKLRPIERGMVVTFIVVFVVIFIVWVWGR